MDGFKEGGKDCFEFFFINFVGFTDAKKPWLPVNPNYYELNVETQKKDPNSNYNFYKKMSELRNTETLKHGGLQTFNISQSIYIVMR